MSKDSSLPSIDNSVIDRLPTLNNSIHELFILRDDLIHNIISGNKWRKLEMIINRVLSSNFLGITTYGGPFSNHVLATACAAKLYGIPCTLRIRGEELKPNSNNLLAYCASTGAKLEFLTRREYDVVKTSYGLDEYGLFNVPEGGACREGILGAMQLGDAAQNFDLVALAQGTATTSLGLLINSPSITEIWVFPVLKGFSSMLEMHALAEKTGFLTSFNLNKSRLRSFDNYHFGGYAKGRAMVMDQIKHCDLKISFPLDPVYTGKAFLGFLSELQKIKEPKKALFIHTGGCFLYS